MQVTLLCNWNKYRFFIGGSDVGNRHGDGFLLAGDNNLIFGQARWWDAYTSTGFLTQLLNESIIRTGDEWMKSFLKRYTIHCTLILRHTTRFQKGHSEDYRMFQALLHLIKCSPALRRWSGFHGELSQCPPWCQWCGCWRWDHRSAGWWSWWLFLAPAPVTFHRSFRSQNDGVPSELSRSLRPARKNSAFKMYFC